jgi:hypothetical protein
MADLVSYFMAKPDQRALLGSEDPRTLPALVFSLSDWTTGVGKR